MLLRRVLTAAAAAGARLSARTHTAATRLRAAAAAAATLAPRRHISSRHPSVSTTTTAAAALSSTPASAPASSPASALLPPRRAASTLAARTFARPHPARRALGLARSVGVERDADGVPRDLSTYRPKVSARARAEGAGGAAGRPSPTPLEHAVVWGSAAALGLSLFASRQKNVEISFEEFRNELLRFDKVLELIVVNDTSVRVRLREDAELSAELRERIPQRAQQTKQFSLFFHIGSVESFEKKVEAAQRDMMLTPEEFVPISYTHEVDVAALLLKMLPTLLMVGGTLYFLMGRNRGALGGIFGAGKIQNAMVQPGAVTIAFKDVAGLGEAKQEIMEFVDFLRNPGKYKSLGAKIPKGALLVGPPGTGKTLLAKAVAGEAKVPFFSMSGSDFVEMFAGVGPARVRSLFEQARKHAPCIVFIDEIDAIGRARSKSAFVGSNDEREGTLNQLLVELDGLQSLSGVVVLAGTNRHDVLDSALTRAGRFDRHIVIENPDIKARKEIFEVHLRPLKLSLPIVDYSRRLAALTPGMSGAEIANVCNEAALIAARGKAASIDLPHFQQAIDRVIAGLERKSRVLAPAEKRRVAYHEAGHAVTGWFREHAEPLLKVSIVPRGAQTLGFAMYLPKDRKLMSEQQLYDMMCMTLGGRAAEKVFFGNVSSGAADDLDRVTQNAYAQVAQLGMDKEIGPQSLVVDSSDPNEMSFEKPFSEATGAMIDARVRDLILRAWHDTVSLLTEKRVLVESLAQRLLEREVISQEDVIEVLGPRPSGEKTTYEQFVFGSDSDAAASTAK